MITQCCGNVPHALFHSSYPNERTRTEYAQRTHPLEQIRRCEGVPPGRSRTSLSDVGRIDDDGGRCRAVHLAPALSRVIGPLRVPVHGVQLGRGIAHRN